MTVNPKIKTQYLSLLVAFSVAVFLYSPGLTGPFLYDDFSNLNFLSIQNNLPESIFSNQSGIFKRPISFISFALQSTDWPENPFAFKLWNLILHLAVGLLIFILLNLITKNLDRANPYNKYIAIIVTFLWLIHPIHTSTVLYVVQRMTILSALFTMIGLVYFINVSKELIVAKTYRRFFLPTFILYSIICISILSKENGVLALFPILILGTSIHNKMAAPYYRYWLKMITIIPLVLVFIYMILKSQSSDLLYLERGFDSALQRLATQGMALLHYLRQILLPNINYMTIFHDDWNATTGTIQYGKAIIAWLIIITLLVFALRTKDTYLKVGILWFFVWHMIESSILPLHAYFEHRNYLASLGPLLILVYLLIKLIRKMDNKLILVAALSIPTFGYTTQLSRLTTVWGNEETLIYHWLENHPTSDRTLINAVNFYLRNNQLGAANAMLKTAMRYKEFKDNLHFSVMKYRIDCKLGKKTSEQQRPIFVNDQNVELLHSQLSLLAVDILNDTCKLQSTKYVHYLFSEFSKLLKSTGSHRYFDILNKQGFIYLREKNYTNALPMLAKSYNKTLPYTGLAIIDSYIYLGEPNLAAKWYNRLEKHNLEDSNQLSSQLNVLKQKYTARFGYDI